MESLIHACSSQVTPLTEASVKGHDDVVTAVLDLGANVNNPAPCSGKTALHLACQQGHTTIVEHLIVRGANIDARDFTGSAPIHSAAYSGRKAALLCLINHGADVNSVTTDRVSSLFYAAQNGHLPVVVVLIIRGADLNLSNKEGATPLMMAAGKGHFEVVKFLVEKGAVVDQTTPAADDVTALSQAALSGHLQIVDFLLSAYKDKLNAKTLKLPLYGAAQRGHLEVVKLLVSKGANVDEAAHEGLTPLHRAAFYGHNEVVDYLIGKGAKFEPIGAANLCACKCCGITGVPLKMCTGCQTVYYCGPECQKKDWKEGGEDKHKIQCARLVEMRARYMEKAKNEIEEKMTELGVSGIEEKP